MADTTPRQRLAVLHVLDRIDAAYGGPAHAVPVLAGEQARCGHDVRIVHRHDGPPAARPVEVADAQRQGVALVAARSRAELAAEMSRCDVAHLHGVWDALPRRAASIAVRSGLPFCWRTAGMLEPWSLAHKPLKKRLGLALVFRRLLDAAPLLQATSGLEAGHLRDIGLQAPLAVIPNPVGGGAAPCAAALGRWTGLPGPRRLLFLSRLNPKKGLPLLAEAWGRLAPRHAAWHLVVAGPDEAGHEAVARRALRAAGVLDRTTFTGPVVGEEKDALLASCHAFCLPSLSENFGVVIGEALAARLPVVTTTETPWTELAAWGCGQSVPPTASALEGALHAILSASDGERAAMGEAGRARVLAEHAPAAVAARVEAAYRHLLGGPRPEWVIPSGAREVPARRA